MSIMNLFLIRRYPKDTGWWSNFFEANPAVDEEYIDINVNDDDTIISNENGDKTHISKSENIMHQYRKIDNNSQRSSKERSSVS